MSKGTNERAKKEEEKMANANVPVEETDQYKEFAQGVLERKPKENALEKVRLILNSERTKEDAESMFRTLAPFMVKIHEFDKEYLLKLFQHGKIKKYAKGESFKFFVARVNFIIEGDVIVQGRGDAQTRGPGHIFGDPLRFTDTSFHTKGGVELITTESGDLHDKATEEEIDKCIQQALSDFNINYGAPVLKIMSREGLVVCPSIEVSNMILIPIEGKLALGSTNKAGKVILVKSLPPMKQTGMEYVVHRDVENQASLDVHVPLDSTMMNGKSGAVFLAFQVDYYAMVKELEKAKQSWNFHVVEPITTEQLEGLISGTASS